MNMITEYCCRIVCICILLSMHCVVWAQSDKKSSSGKKIERVGVQKAAEELSKSLDESADESKIAADYEALAKELIGKKSYDKAEDYLKRAARIYEKQNQKEKLSAVNREIAKVAELQGKFDNAADFYDKAAKVSGNSLQRQLNQNDAGRVKNHPKPEAQSSYIQQNIALLEKEQLPEEKALAYQQMAENSIQLNQNTAAISNFEKALENIPKENKEAVSVQNKMAEVYVSEKKYEEAIGISEKLVAEKVRDKDIEGQIAQLRSLSNIYLSDDKSDEGIAVLLRAYDLALKEGRTLDAKECVEMLGNIYLKENKYRESIDLYKDFLGRLELLIGADSTLTDSKVFHLTEERIDQLEKEKELKDKLIEGKNTFNLILIVSLIALAVLLLLIVKALYANKNKNKKIALQSLRREMNPHFIFNSLNSVNRFIAQNNELEANKYLTSYSRLMRNVMENSGKDFIKLSTELEQLTEYLQLEQLRFGDKFSYDIQVGENIDTESFFVPNMLIQPQLENAVWHGLRYKSEKGLLRLIVELKNGRIVVTVDDDGIGLSRSKEMKTENQKVHISRGLTNISERIRLLNDLYKTNITMDVKEKEAPESGVTVTLYF